MKEDAFPLFRGHWQLRCQNSLFTVPDFFVTSSGSRADTEGAGYDTHPRWPLLTQSAYGKTRDSEQFTAKMFPEFTQVSLLSGLCGYRKLHRKVKCFQQQAMKMLIVEGIYQGLLNFVLILFHSRNASLTIEIAVAASIAPYNTTFFRVRKPACQG